MFEKEAEEKSVVYVDKLAKERHFEKGTSYTVGLEEGYNDGFKDGAEFGYNKANEWHYVKNGDLPKEGENVLCYCKGPGFMFCCVGNTIVGGDNKVRWWANNKSEKLQVIAWKEIVLPEPKESENG